MLVTEDTEDIPDILGIKGLAHFVLLTIAVSKTNILRKEHIMRSLSLASGNTGSFSNVLIRKPSASPSVQMLMWTPLSPDLFFWLVM